MMNQCLKIRGLLKSAQFPGMPEIILHLVAVFEVECNRFLFLRGEVLPILPWDALKFVFCHRRRWYERR